MERLDWSRGERKPAANAADAVHRYYSNLSSYAAELRADAAHLLELWREHLALEEETVFPLIRARLTADDLNAIHHEMKQRRGIEGQ